MLKPVYNYVARSGNSYKIFQKKGLDRTNI